MGEAHTSSFKSFNLLLSRFGRLITSAFSRCSAASPVMGFAPAPGVGLSFALTQAATPRSGISRVTLPYMAATSWLCRCSVSVPGTVRNQSIFAESSAWLYCPGICVSACLVGIMPGTYVRLTHHKEADSLFVCGPILAHGRFERRVKRLEVDARRHMV